MYTIHLLQQLRLPGLRQDLLLPLNDGPRLWLLVRNVVVIFVVIVVDVAAGVDSTLVTSWSLSWEL